VVAREKDVASSISGNSDDDDDDESRSSEGSNDADEEADASSTGTRAGPPPPSQPTPMESGDQVDAVNDDSDSLDEGDSSELAEDVRLNEWAGEAAEAEAEWAADAAGPLGEQAGGDDGKGPGTSWSTRQTPPPTDHESLALLQQAPRKPDRPSTLFRDARRVLATGSLGDDAEDGSAVPDEAVLSMSAGLTARLGALLPTGVVGWWARVARPASTRKRAPDASSASADAAEPVAKRTRPADGAGEAGCAVM
jgi:hypothetical protein